MGFDDCVEPGYTAAVKGFGSIHLDCKGCKVNARR